MLQSNARSSGPARLQGHTLFIKALWVVVAMVAAGIAFTAIRAKYDQIIALSSLGLGESWSPAAFRASLAQFGLSIEWFARYRVVLDLLFVSSFFAVAALIVWHMPKEWMALFVSLFLVTFAANWVIYPPTMPAMWYWPVQILDQLTWTSFIFFFVLFPDGQFVPHWTRLLIVGLPLFALLTFFLGSWLPGINFPLWLAILGCAATAQVYRYRSVSGEVQRQQTKWVALGFMAIFAMLLLLILLEALFPALNEPGRLGLLYTLSGFAFGTVLFLPIPLSIGIALLRYRLWDIDILINRTLVYVPLMVMLGMIFSIAQQVSSRFLTGFWGENSAASMVVTTLIIVAVFDPLKKRIERVVDKYANRIPDPVHTVKVFRKKVHSRVLQVNTETLTQQLLEEAVLGFGATSGAVYLDHEDSLQPFNAKPIHATRNWNGKAQLTIPLRSADEGPTHGALVLGPPRAGGDYSERQCALVQEMAQVAVAALEQDQQFVPPCQDAE